MFQDGNNGAGGVAGVGGGALALLVFKNENIDDLYILNII